VRRLADPRFLLILALVAYPLIRPYDAYPQVVLLLAFLLATQAVGWNIISGYAGYVSLGHSVFLGLGSYTAGIVGAKTGLNPFLLAPLGGLVAVVAAVLAGSVVLRTRGHAFVIITIALLLATQVIATNWDALTNGSDGITLALPTWSRDILNLPFYFAFLALMLASIGFSAWIRRTKFGTGLVAIREDEGKAAAIGVDTTRYKIAAYGASVFVSGMAGAVYAYFLTFLNPIGAFSILGSVTIVLAALVGGRGTLWGPVLGAFIVQIASELATVYGGGTQSRVLVFGLALVLVVLFLPAGLLPTVEAWWRRRHPQEVTYTDHGGALAKGSFTLRIREPETALDERPLLEVRRATKRFGGLVAVDHADLRVEAGSITALIGPNGSGKTTLFNLVTGTMRADAGEVWFDGQRIDPPARSAGTRRSGRGSCSRSSGWRGSPTSVLGHCPTASRSWSSWRRC
jgi:ABC-type branched-subunit amino acid transport system permease subunit